MERLTINFKGKIRTERLGGREYLVAPLTLVVHGVLAGNKGPLYYPQEELEKDPAAWNHTPMVVYHPKREDGTAISARSPGVIEKSGVGYVFNAYYDRVRGRLKAEGWFDKERTLKVDRRVYDRLMSGQTIELSTGLYTENEPKSGVFNSRQYDYIARNYRPDHLAILPDEIGACSCNDGCGVLVNKRQSPTTNCEGDTMCSACAAKHAMKKKRKKKKGLPIANGRTFDSLTSRRDRNLLKVLSGKKPRMWHQWNTYQREKYLEEMLNNSATLNKGSGSNCGIASGGFQKGNVCAKGGGSRTTAAGSDRSRAESMSQEAVAASKAALDSNTKESHRTASDKHRQAARFHRAAAANTTRGERASHKFQAKYHYAQASMHESAAPKGRGRDVISGGVVARKVGRGLKSAGKFALGATLGYGTSQVARMVARRISKEIGVDNPVGETVATYVASKAVGKITEPYFWKMGSAGLKGRHLGELLGSFQPKQISDFGRQVGSKLKTRFRTATTNALMRNELLRDSPPLLVHEIVVNARTIAIQVQNANCGIGTGGFQKGNVCAKGSKGGSSRKVKTTLGGRDIDPNSATGRALAKLTEQQEHEDRIKSRGGAVKRFIKGAGLSAATTLAGSLVGGTISKTGGDTFLRGAGLGASLAGLAGSAIARHRYGDAGGIGASIGSGLGTLAGIAGRFGYNYGMAAHHYARAGKTSGTLQAAHRRKAARSVKNAWVDLLGVKEALALYST